MAASAVEISRRGRGARIAGGPSIGDPAFWHQPLAERMAQFGLLRERSPFARATFTDILTGEEREFFAATRYADVVEISRRPLEFCSGQGSTSINDLPQDAME